MSYAVIDYAVILLFDTILLLGCYVITAIAIISHDDITIMPIARDFRFSAPIFHMPPILSSPLHLHTVTPRLIAALIDITLTDGAIATARLAIRYLRH